MERLNLKKAMRGRNMFLNDSSENRNMKKGNYGKWKIRKGQF